MARPTVSFLLRLLQTQMAFPVTRQHPQSVVSMYVGGHLCHQPGLRLFGDGVDVPGTLISLPAYRLCAQPLRSKL
ncbi:hypothetical protein GGR56DRAFT_648862 [Xylariaceae sp. FL0804]|nr:hypothetical protein GGR56DRAFT_648862 [Xylariaceae sp. FL0804]